MYVYAAPSISGQPYYHLKKTCQESWRCSRSSMMDSWRSMRVRLLDCKNQRQSEKGLWIEHCNIYHVYFLIIRRCMYRNNKHKWRKEPFACWFSAVNFNKKIDIHDMFWLIEVQMSSQWSLLLLCSFSEISHHLCKLMKALLYRIWSIFVVRRKNHSICITVFSC
jgi:hypothetical protein